jgi:Ca2+-binding RTX toxin-like protein
VTGSGRYFAACGLVLALLGAPSEARGSLVFRGDGGVFYNAEAGEANELTVDFVSVDPASNFHVFSDSGATITAGPGCFTVDQAATVAACFAEPGDDVIVDLLDENDQLVSISDFGVAVCAGVGDDLIVGGDPPDVLEGQAGRDTLAGLDATDVLVTEVGPLCDDGSPRPPPSPNEVDGGAGDDIVVGGAGPDTVDGGDGGDFVCAGDGDDAVTGGEGDDVVLDEADQDSVSGGAGNDFIHNSFDWVDPTLGCDEGRAAPPPSPNEVDAGPGADSVTGDAGADSIDGGDGDDLVCAAEGDDPLTGGEGNDRLFGEGGRDFFDAGGGDDSVFTEAACSVPPGPDPSPNEVHGGDGSDLVGGGGAEDSIDAGSGNDGVCAGAGDDPVTGGEGDDTLLGEAGHDTIDGGGGTDLVITETLCNATVPPGEPSPNDVDGGAGPDLLIGGKGSDFLTGGEGDDSLFGEQVERGAGGDAADQLSGGAGNDALVGHDGADVLDGGDGNDELSGGNDDDDIAGGPGDDVLGRTVNQSFTDSSGQLQRVTTVENGSDQMDAGPGDDLLNGSIGDTVLNRGLEGSISAFETGSPNGADNLIGGTGHDMVTYVNLTLPVRITPDGTADDGSSGEGDNVQPDNEVLVGGSAGDTLIGSEAGETLDGGKGDDTIEGRGGDDTLRGGAGDEGADIVRGGAGADSVGGGPGGDTLDGEAGADSVDGGGGGDNAAGGDDSDRVSGGPGLDSLSGGPGDDRLRGAADGLIGADGADVLRGDDGTDDLDGGPGNDTLAGGRGPDVLAGAAGDDTADYQDAGGPVTAKLDGLAGDGEKGEGDLIQADVEGLRGGAGHDLLVGNREPNTIAGGGGADFADGRRGADNLQGGDGSDVVRARDRSDDRVACGASRDLTIVDGLDRVGGDCERIAEPGRQRPVLGRSMVVRPVNGSNAMRLPGAPRAIPLMDNLRLPLRTSLDARNGALRVTTARGRGGRQSGIFSGGRFGVRQDRTPGAGAELRLRGGGFDDCAGEEIVRVLRGRGQGDFRTVGRASVTTTTGRASWVVRDRCDGTLSRIRRGNASVLDLNLDRSVTLTGGDSYLAGAQ